MKRTLILLAALVATTFANIPDVPISVQTSGTGTNYAALPSQSCAFVTILNDTGTKLQVKLKNSSTPIPLPDGVALNRLAVHFNANEVSVRRADTSNTQVTVTAIGIH